ncbi:MULTISPECIES: TetR/AcrR family transcriptional regulator [Staphylococcus]|jgi:AcrR family transcriptional regulator|uniref:TetR/AcrR family transcriptional regulator n=1 Tax=Staphylococcus TaxID=1279 RepID=UPI0016424D83|nr:MULTISPECIES: TetR/AcrR family transcriptional regulator [Staphylococcus]MBC2922084.1 TetR/AcrR family transcriptional regulator [Staphylococcus saprophyticus]MBC2958654.1 TetR/AcrR family transcriptional regulator [Staphylococcus saprophyticus]MBC3010531.1 TetR/AcrR family transcriptional regulator [Staphylococcus saprophyticus]MBC3024404.1 TetR/AcrR family transcriptional regulator [Staphylococcus saprophyticus]MBC3031645.1 TetR/AcrR family transcriptional regulator [Staphylococcus saprop
MTESKNKQSAKERILNAAEELFYNEGIQSVGIDRIVKESHVALNTFYRYFTSKDKLIEAYLKNRDIKWMNWLNDFINQEDEPIKKILLIFDALGQWFNEDKYRGCAFINASGELGSTKPFIYDISKMHKENLYNEIYQILTATNIEHEEKTAKKMMILTEGAIVQSYVIGDKEAATNAKEIAKSILKGISNTD